MVYYPVATRVNNDGEDRERFARMGIKVTMQDNTWWFLHFRAGSWTHHWKGVMRDAPVDRKTTYTATSLRREYRHAPSVLAVLDEGVRIALTDEMQRRLEFGVAKWGGLLPTSCETTHNEPMTRRNAA